MNKVNSKTQWSYDLLNIIGQGASSCVYKAIRKCQGVTFEQEVAVKILYSENQVELLKDEVNKLLNIRSGKTVSVYGWDYIDGHPAIIMEFINGVTLADLYKQSWLDESEINEICAQVTVALNEINEFGVNHGDLNLSNIMIDMNGHIRILDFGFKTENGICVTPDFACPTILAGQKPTLSSDIYSIIHIQRFLLNEIKDGDLKNKKRARSSQLIIAGLAEKVVFLMSQRQRDLPSTKIIECQVKPKRISAFIKSAAMFLFMLLIVGEGPKSRAQDFILLEVKTLKWVQVMLPDNRPIYSPFKILLPHHDKIKLSWKTQNSSGVLLLYPRAGEKILINDQSFR
jgi:serine/threonine protein kinase